QDVWQSQSGLFVVLGGFLLPRAAEPKRTLPAESRRSGRERPRQGADTRAPALDLSRSAG
ncbi:hypothetical protein ABEV34_07610, partial [Methylorubrum rhodesianum]